MATANNSQSNGNSNLEVGEGDQGLIINKSKWRKRKFWILGAVVAVVVIAAIVAAVLIINAASKTDSEASGTQSALALEDFLQGRTATRSFNGTWISGTELLYRTINGTVILYDAKEQTSTQLLSEDDGLSFKMEVNETLNSTIVNSANFVELSPDRKYVLLAYNYRSIYRHSFIAEYAIVDLETKDVYNLAVGNSSINSRVMQLVVWGPEGNSLFFVYLNNIYYKASPTSDEIIQLTNDGILRVVYNGIPDWVYEEEVFASNKALWVSPDGKKVAYAKFDDTEVQTMKMPLYGEPGALTSQYTRIVELKYPKPGTKNPTVTLFLVDLSNSSGVRELVVPAPVESEDPILVSAVWATNDTLVAVWMNRVQNKASIIAYDASSNASSSVITTIEEENGWLELFVPPKFSKDGSEFLFLLSQDQGGSLGSYRHITLLSRSDGKQRAVTSGTFVVKDILGWNEEDNLIYYQAPAEGDPGTQHIYSVSTITNETSCISCNVNSSTTNVECLYNSATFSTDFSFYFLSCEGPSVPEVSLFSINQSRLRLWEGNEEVRELVEDKLVPTIERLTVDVADGYVAQVQLKLPPNIDKSGQTKYPMLVNVYGGPDSYQVAEKFGLGWGSYLSANKSIIYAMIDGRGSGLKGDKMLFEIYRSIGTVEVVDQINVTKQIHEKLPFVDSTRTAIWGWSYGGYVAGMALATDTEGVFKCGISVAPVTDWTLYDSIYTERFMGLPSSGDNLSGYTTAQLITHSTGLRDKEYFLIHGSLDDNVHYQQSMLWAKQLEHDDVLFRQQSYTDESHSLNYVRPHLYHSLESFLDECFIEKDKDSE